VTPARQCQLGRLAGELQRDWGRVATVAEIVDIVLTTRLLTTAGASRERDQSVDDHM